MKPHMPLGISALGLCCSLLTGAATRADEVDILTVSHDFQSLPRSVFVVTSVPQPSKPGGKLEIAASLGEIMTEELVAAIQKQIPSAKVLTDSADPPEQQALILDCNFSKLVPGSRAKRFWVGFGAGKSILEVSGEIRENPSGRVVARFTHARLSWCCGFGRNDKEIRDNLVLAANDIAAVVAGHFHAKQAYQWLPDDGPSTAPPRNTPSATSLGTLVIDSSESHADVEIDGKFVGTTLLEIQLTTGRHAVTMRKGTAAWSREIEVLTGSKQNIWAELNAAPQAQPEEVRP